MYALICLFLPAVISVWITEKLRKTSFTGKKWFYRLALNTTLINFGCCAAKKWFLGTGDTIISGLSTDMSPSIACNYLIISAAVAAVVVLLQVLPISFHLRKVENSPEVQNDTEDTVSN